jgi:hypothetical protein
MNQRATGSTNQKDRAKALAAIPPQQRLLALIFLILEAAFAATIFVLPEGQRFAAFVIFVIVLASAAFLGFRLIQGETTASRPPDYKALTGELTDNDVRVLNELACMHNTLPSILFDRSPDAPSDICKFTRRLVLLTQLGLVSTVGGSEVAITDASWKFLKKAKTDNRYDHIFA